MEACWKSLNMSWEFVAHHAPFIIAGVFTSIKFAFVSLVLGLLLAIVLAVARLCPYKIIRLAIGFYISVFRGTPLLVQLVLIFFALPQLLNISLSPFLACIIAFSLNSAAYSAEIIRAGIQSIDKGQHEAAQTLGLTLFQTYRYVILPQAIRRVLPALGNEAINLLKESALVSVVGELDILRRAQIVASETYLYFEPLLIAGLIYYILVLTLTACVHSLERKFSNA